MFLEREREIERESTIQMCSWQICSVESHGCNVNVLIAPDVLSSLLQCPEELSSNRGDQTLVKNKAITYKT